MSIFRARPVLILTAWAIAGSAAAADRVVHLCDFETAGDLKAWDFVAGKPRLVDEGVTHGRRALEIRFDPKGRYQPAYIYWRRPRRDWSGFDADALKARVVSAIESLAPGR